ncbi:pentapeptide repeat-containing protein [Roseomonas xinghualingensis]|uniref:pentapeptide repeat-containing protein n=1 Tax=Roseomonas xinghualingensis TaxID=2986475 RepID=UPI0021F1D47D|nr:pentapeptide repeat-containing protein [Roseomonas sp. SXEYE001]MCV4208578.1 pentapeptide repeat-containing protein [Roseomonas sp. SXEYE001]
MPDTPETVPVEIKDRWDASRVLFRAEVDASIPLFGRIKAAVLLAVKAKTYLGGANLRGAYLGDADLRGADLRGANLRGAYLGDAYLGGAYLGGADLGDANLRGADLRGANLRGAYLGDANLGGADLGGADLGGADLGGANLGGAKIRLKTGLDAKLADDRPILQIGPIGSRGDTLMIFNTDQGVVVQTGCFGPAPLSEFAEAVRDEHGEAGHGRDYLAAVRLIEAMFPVAAAAERDAA